MGAGQHPNQEARKMCGLKQITNLLHYLGDRLAPRTVYQIREGNQTRWMSVDEFIRQEIEQPTKSNQGVFHAPTRKRTIIAIQKTGALPFQTDAGGPHK
jgi:hypothetical protein